MTDSYLHTGSLFVEAVKPVTIKVLTNTSHLLTQVQL